MSKENKATVTYLFRDELEKTQHGERIECPGCPGYDRELMVNRKKNTVFCYHNHTSFNFLEAVALKFGIIGCDEGRQDSEETSLKGQAFTDTIKTVISELGVECIPEEIKHYKIVNKIIENPSYNDEGTKHYVEHELVADVGLPLTIVMFREKIKVIHGVETITNIKINNTIPDTIVGKFARILVDLGFDKIQEARQFLVRKELYDTLCIMKKRLEEKYREGISESTISVPLKVDNYMDNVRLYHKMKPFFYDRSRLFWFWNPPTHRWIERDEIDVMNDLDNSLQMHGQTVSNVVKMNYIEAFKRVGRSNIPKDPPNHWIQFKDIIFDLETEETFKATEEYFFVNPIPFGLGEKDETPVMDSLFSDWVGAKKAVTLFEIIAYCCCKQYNIHIINALIGGGANGKTTFQRILSKFIGEHNICSTELESLTSRRFESYKLYKKLVCVMGETSYGLLQNTQLLKKLTGEDLIGFERKGKDPFDDFSYAKLIVNSNSLPTSTDTSVGFYRRWNIIEFVKEFPEGGDITKTIPDQEYNNLARKVTKILPTLLKNGSFSGQGTIDERKKGYIMASNPLQYFIEACCDVGNDADFIRTNDLFKAYHECLKAGKRRLVTKKEFSKAIEEEGFYATKTSRTGDDGKYLNGYFFDGVKLKDGWKTKIKTIYDNCDNCDNCDNTSTPALSKEQSKEPQHKRHKRHKNDKNKLKVEKTKNKKVDVTRTKMKIHTKKEPKKPERKQQFYEYEHSKVILENITTSEKVLEVISKHAEGISADDVFEKLGDGTFKILNDLTESGTIKCENGNYLLVGGAAT